MNGSNQLTVKNWWEEVATTPWIEAIILAVTGFVLLAFDKLILAELAWILGVALSFTRYAIITTLTKSNEEVFKALKINNEILFEEKLIELVNNYLKITEPEFKKLKESMIIKTNESISKMAQLKKSQQIPTGSYYDWLLSYIKSTKAGSNIWAISMMLEVEWIDSVEEIEFLKQNMAAADRGVKLERIFVVNEADLPDLLSNKGIKAHYENTSISIHPKVAIKEILKKRDPNLLEDLGDGLIAFDRRVVLIDVVTPGGMRGIMTMERNEIDRLRNMFDSLTTLAYDLNEVDSMKNEKST